MEKREVDYSENNKVIESNDYIKAYHPEMGINAMKLLRLVIAQCRKSDKEFYEYDFQITDLAKAIGIDSSNIYKGVHDVCVRLKQVVLEKGAGDPRKKWKLKSLIEECEYDPETGVISISLHKDVAEMFLRLNGDYTEMPIIALLSLKTKHSIRLYELICSRMLHNYPYANVSTEITVSLEDAKLVTDTNNKKAYDQVGHFKAKVLLPALAEIERSVWWKILCVDVKRGRRIIGFTLQIWTAIGYAMIEKCKAEGKLPPGEPPKQIHGQMSLFE